MKSENLNMNRRAPSFDVLVDSRNILTFSGVRGPRVTLRPPPKSKTFANVDYANICLSKVQTNLKAVELLRLVVHGAVNFQDMIHLNLLRSLHSSYLPTLKKSKTSTIDNFSSLLSKVQATGSEVLISLASIASDYPHHLSSSVVRWPFM